tara:strand:- start:75 stop:194 length:120 start_codon:yes stop_codon:yes gene_type:complete
MIFFKGVEYPKDVILFAVFFEMACRTVTLKKSYPSAALR